MPFCRTTSCICYGYNSKNRKLINCLNVEFAIRPVPPALGLPVPQFHRDLDRFEWEAIMKHTVSSNQFRERT